MKPIILLSILFCVIAIPALAELTDADLDKIRLIVKEEVKAEITKTNDKIDKLEERLRAVETDIAELRGQRTAFSLIKDWGIALSALGALIVSIIALTKKYAAATQPPDEQFSQTAEQL